MIFVPIKVHPSFMDTNYEQLGVHEEQQYQTTRSLFNSQQSAYTVSKLEIMLRISWLLCQSAQEHIVISQHYIPRNIYTFQSSIFFDVSKWQHGTQSHFPAMLYLFQFYLPANNAWFACYCLLADSKQSELFPDGTCCRLFAVCFSWSSFFLVGE